MTRQIISTIITAWTVAFVGYGAVTRNLNYQSGGTILLAVLAYWADPPRGQITAESATGRVTRPVVLSGRVTRPVGFPQVKHLLKTDVSTENEDGEEHE